MAINNERLLHAQHRGVSDSSDIINGVSLGGLMSASIQCGYDDIVTAGADGYSFPETDRLTQFVRGTIQCQDWKEVLNVLGGASSRYVFYERESGGATWRMNTLYDPYIHSATLNFDHRGRASVSFGFECWASDAATGFSALWARSDAMGLPSDVISYSPGMEMTAGILGTSPVLGEPFYHLLNLTVNISGQIVRASGDGDVGYTAVDIVWGGVPMGGSMTFQDASDAWNLLQEVESDLYITINQCQGESDAYLILQNVLFTNLGSTSSAGPGHTPYTLDFILNSDGTTPIGYDTNLPFVGDAAGIEVSDIDL